MIKRILSKTDKRCLYKFMYNMVFKGMISFARYRKRLKSGAFFPAFTFISVTDDCNLECQGCWVTHKTKNARMSPETLNRIIEENKAKGSYFFGILGGEPLLYRPLLDVLKKHSDCYFQLFTNGTLLTPVMAEELRKLGNITPLISFEGDEMNADIRRRGKNIYSRTLEAVENATQAGLITGVAISVCKSNIEMALSESFLESLVRKNVSYLWYYIYRPVGADSSVELALDASEIQKLREHMVNIRSTADLVIIDAYWDQDGNGLCPAATGLSHHINASGFVEPCPVIQFATHNVENSPLETIYRESEFLSELRKEIPGKTSGCIVMEDPAWLVQKVNSSHAKDTSGRNNELERLLAMKPVPSHGSGTPVREKNWMYRFAKKRAFFGLGAYG